MMAVWCDTCEHMHLPSKNARASQALCLKHKNVGGFGFVSQELWDSEEPYLRCSRMNPRGTCPLYEPKRDNQMESGE